MKKIIAMILCALMLCFVLSSCTSGGDTVVGGDTVGGSDAPESEEKGFFDKVEDFVNGIFGNDDADQAPNEESDITPNPETDAETNADFNDDKNWTGIY